MSSLFGGGSAPQINFTPQGFSGGGLNATFQGGKYNLTQSPALTQQIGQLQSTFGKAAGAFGALGAQVQPGFSQFRQAGLADLSNQQSANLSNLRDSLAQRRILGSSFANASISQANADYDKNRADFIAQSYLQELQASNTFTQEQYQAATQQFATGINQMNFESTMAANLTSQANQVMGQIATQNAQLQAANAAANAQGLGKLLGVGAAIGLAPFTGGMSLAALPGVLGGGGGGMPAGTSFGTPSLVSQYQSAQALQGTPFQMG